MDNIENIKRFLESLNDSLDHLEDKLYPLITQSLDDIVKPIESPIDRIEVYNNYAYLLVSLIYSYLKSTGVSVENHPIMKELDRIKLYTKRHKDLMDNTNNDGDKDELDTKSKEYLIKMLGKSGTTNTVQDSGPAISTTTIKGGTHTKFN